ncbi:hypothetical protein CABS01_09362 [Colletotrichum abscissum]|uniref:Uncharacterized protein n=1 Tax=Colletotrichum costaricense TaxID=1209916 RepID=A0AAI9YZT2_9PEZI|nr:uncharacterized protein CCOS01_06662 [Colletotrichum costaricense]XP_060400446.1 uncharacterized protein CABS01_09362 [Colletotrichum abscissum]KAI3533493.1 hypothetical protein CSPX01_12721 [Colletotrichum filicis]KAK1502751.1 hypothetical protein CABS01_09362 [Colletotrichum abscissum]KAK1528828.1 hypothetical protein CCOS01_06662 [Colletotrichum costaricense]
MSVTILILGREPTRHYNIIDNSKDPTRSAVSGLQHTGTDTSIRSQTTDPEQSDSAAPTREIPGARIHARRSDTIPVIIDTIPSQATRTFHLPCPSASGHFVETDQGDDGEVACALQRDRGDDDFAI